MVCYTILAEKDALGWPIVGTDRPYFRVPCGCAKIELPAEQIAPVGNEFQKYHPQGLRYFYRINCDTGQVLPSSLFISTKHPGQGVLEYKKLLTP